MAPGDTEARALVPEELHIHPGAIKEVSSEAAPKLGLKGTGHGLGVGQGCFWEPVEGGWHVCE